MSSLGTAQGCHPAKTVALSILAVKGQDKEPGALGATGLKQTMTQRLLVVMQSLMYGHCSEHVTYTEAQRGLVTHPRSHSMYALEQDSGLQHWV